MTDALIVGDLTFALRFSARRKTVGITIERDGTLVLAAPSDSTRDQLEQFAREKQKWVYTKLAERELLVRPSSPKEYVSGEGFSYLGRSYRLLLIPAASGDAVPPLRLQHGRFLLRRDARDRAGEHFVRWYADHAQPWLARRVGLFADRIGVRPAAVEVRELGYRWGSCGRGGALYFHWRTITLPPRIVEYVVVHELVHLAEPSHSPSFWKRLERAIPDAGQRREWLAEHGGEY